MNEKYGQQGFQVVAVHTPEFEFEKERARVERAVARYRKIYPVFMDNDYAYWNALSNRYWPAFYLVDKDGRIRSRHIGEVHQGESSGRRMEQMIRALLQEKVSG